MPDTPYFAARDFKLSRFERSIIFILTLSICIAVLYRFQLQNGFNILPGDRFDGVISTSILEHWSNVFLGIDKWSEVNYFFPYSKTIAQTDAYFLIGLLYFPFRLCGFDPFISAEFAAIAIKIIGFVSAYYCSRRVFRFSFWYALLIAVLFTMNNGMTSHSSRVQLSTVAFAPLLALMIFESAKAFLQNRRMLALLFGSLSSVLFAAWCFTCFYMAWFFLFFFSFFAPIYWIVSRTDLRGTIVFKLREHFVLLLVIALVGLIALLPFLSVYIPKSKEVGLRTYETVSTFILPIEGVLEVGQANLIWGNFYSKLLAIVSPQYAITHEYSNTGFTFPLFFLFVMSVVQIFRQQRTSPSPEWRALAFASVLTLLLSLKFYNYSAWYFVYHFFPGAKALNVVAAFQIFLALPITLIAIRGLSQMRFSSGWKLLLSALLIASELNVPYLNLHRQEQLNEVAVPISAPTECRVFYVSTWDNQDRISDFSASINDVYPHNVTAIMLAQVVHLPTINGIASFNPPDWNFVANGASSYEERIAAYAKKHDIKGLCRFDLNTKQWQQKTIIERQ